LKILVVAANREKFPDPVFPLGASYIANSLELAGYSVDIFDANFSENPQDDLKQKLTDFNPEVVAFSIRNVDNNAFPKATSYLDYYKSMTKVIKETGNSLLVVGGSAFTIFPEYFLQELQADFGISGEGEYAFLKLLDEIKTGVFEKNKVIYSDSIKDINFEHFPSRNGFDVEKYFQMGGCINIQMKRGCAFDCSYCTYPSIEGHCYRMREPKKIVDEIQYWYETKGVTHYFFVDSVFNHPEEYALEVINEIVKRKLDIKWSGFFAPIFSETFVDACLSAGLASMDLGTDAFSNVTLKGFHKFFTVDDIFRSCEICTRKGIKFNHSMIFGGPGETMDTLKETIRNIDLSNPTSVIGFIGVRVYPNTPIAKELGWDDVGIEPVFYVSPDVQDTLVDYLKEVVENRRGWIVPGLDKGVNMALFERMRKRGIKGQLWEKMS